MGVWASTFGRISPAPLFLPTPHLESSAPQLKPTPWSAPPPEVSLRQGGLVLQLGEALAHTWFTL